ncbi:MAG: MFS transporter [Pseudomonadota bacterium]
MNDRPILALALAQTLVWACLYYSFPALLLHWERGFNWTRADLTGALTAAVFASALCSPVYGKLVDAGRGALMMTLSTVCGGLMLGALVFVSQLWQFYGLWIGIGICMSGCLYEPCFALITRARGTQAKRSIIFITLVAGFAGTVSFPVAHAVSSNFGWQTTVLVFAGLAIFVVAPLMWVGGRRVEQTGDARVIDTQNQHRRYDPYLGSPVFWSLAIAFGLVAITHGTALHHLLPLLNERNLHPEIAVMAISFIGPMQVAGRLAMMVAEPYISNHGIVVCCFGLMALSIVFLIGAGSVPAFLVIFVILFGGAYGMVSVIRPVIARELLGGEKFGAKSGTLSLVYLAGSASAPLLGSLIWSLGGYDVMLQCLLVVAAIGLTLYLNAQKRFIRSRPNSDQ